MCLSIKKTNLKARFLTNEWFILYILVCNKYLIPKKIYYLASYILSKTPCFMELSENVIKEELRYAKLLDHLGREYSWLLTTRYGLYNLHVTSYKLQAIWCNSSAK